MKTRIFSSLIFSLLLITFGNTYATTYKWQGASGGTWTTASNWYNTSTGKTGSGYPGSAANDIAEFTTSYTNTISVSTAPANAISQITIDDLGSGIVTVSSGITLTITAGIATGNNYNGVQGITFLGAGTVNIGGTTSFNNQGSITIGASGAGSQPTVNFTAGSTLEYNSNNSFVTNYGTLNFKGTSASSVNLNLEYKGVFTNNGTVNFTYTTINFNGTPCNMVNAGTIVATSSTFNTPSTTYITTSSKFYATSCTFNLTGSGSGAYIANTAIFSATSCTFTLSGTAAYLSNSGSSSNFTTYNCTYTLSGSGQTGAYISNSATYRDHGSTISMTGQSTAIQNSGSTSVMHLSGTSITTSGGNNTMNITNAGTFTADSASTISIGTYLCYIANTLTGTFYAGTSGSACTINLTGQGSFVTNAGNFYLGSTSIINPTGYAASVINVTGTFTLQSDASGSAAIGTIPTTSGGCIGTFTVQRYVTGGSTYSNNRWIYRNYRLMSSPVNLGEDGNDDYPYSLNYIAASTIVTGAKSSISTVGGNPSIYLYNEGYSPNSSTFVSGNFLGVTDISNTSASGSLTTTDPNNKNPEIYVGEGFFMYFRGDNIHNLTGTPSKTKAPYVAPESVTFSATGNINQGTYSVKSFTGYEGLLYTQSNSGNAAIRGFNLVGNPYPSAIDWSTFSSTNSSAAIYGPNVNPTIYILNPTTGNYDTYNASTGIATGSASKIIPSGQGFFVQANNHSASLTFTEAAKSTSQVTGSKLLLGTPADQTAYTSYLRLKLVTDSVNNSDIVIGFNAASSAAFNPVVDAQFHPGSAAAQSLASITSDNFLVSAKWLPLPKDTLSHVIKLNVNVNASGQYTFCRTDLMAIPQLYEVLLVDNNKKDTVDLRSASSYAFNVNTSDTTTFGSNRFAIVIRENPALALRLLNFTAAKQATTAEVVWSTANEQNYTNFTVERSTDNGATFKVLGGYLSSGLGTYSFSDNNPLYTANQYRLKLEDINGTITYSKVVTLMFANINSAAVNNLSLYPNPASSVINLAVNTNSSATSDLSGFVLNSTSSTALYNIKIININGAVIQTATSKQPVWQGNVGNLAPGTYIIQVTNSSNNSLVGKNTFIKL